MIPTFTSTMIRAQKSDVDTLAPREAAKEGRSPAVVVIRAEAETATLAPSSKEASACRS